MIGNAMQRIVFYIVLSALLFVAFPAAYARKWTDNTGKYSIDADLVAVNHDDAQLKKQNDQIVTVLLSRLSKADLDYLASQQKRALAAITELGGTVTKKGTPPGLHVNLKETLVTDDDLKHLKWLPNISILDLSSTKISDAGLEHLKGLTNLTELSLGYTYITDAGLK